MTWIVILWLQKSDCTWRISANRGCRKASTFFFFFLSSFPEVGLIRGCLTIWLIWQNYLKRCLLGVWVDDSLSKILFSGHCDKQCPSTSVFSCQPVALRVGLGCLASPILSARPSCICLSFLNVTFNIKMPLKDGFHKTLKTKVGKLKIPRSLESV